MANRNGETEWEEELVCPLCLVVKINIVNKEYILFNKMQLINKI